MTYSVLPPAARLGLLASLLALAACKKDSDQPATALPTTVAFTQTGLYPEGTQYDDQQAHFLVSSQTAGRLGQVADDGSYAAFADDASLISTIGLRLDADRNRVLAAVSDPGYNTARTSAATKGKLAGLASFNRTTGARLGYVDLAALGAAYPAHFANDIAVDAAGNAYVTDSFAPIIYKVDPQGAASVFLVNAALAAPSGKFGLNGIVYHPGGYLIVAKSDEGALFKVPLASPTSFTKITATGLDLSGVDGLQLVDNTTLLAVCNAQGKVYQLTGASDFGSVSSSGTPFATGGVYPTTLARRAGQASYVLYSHLNALQAMQNPPVAEFSLQKVSF